LAVAAGYAFARTTETGERQFNREAAVIVGTLGAALLRSIM
jgi:hypothetical protein